MVEPKTSGVALGALLDAVGLEAPSVPEARLAEVRVTGVCHDSRLARPGDLFVAIVGERFDGRAYVPAALERGAVAILGPALPDEPLAGEPLADDPLAAVRAAVRRSGAVWIDVTEPRRVMGEMARSVYGAPGERLLVVGVTGTNGKSTTVALVASMLTAAGRPSARLGTLGYAFGEREWRAGGRTTPEAPDLHRLLAEMERAGARAAAMEVSSHALELGRVDELSFDLAVFTNLSRDHLDFHGDMESYFAAKQKLFDRLKPGGRAVVHLGEGPGDWGRRLAELLRSRGLEVVTCGTVPGADVHPVATRLDLEGLEARLATPRGEVRIVSPLLGRFHLLNLITAAAAGVALGLDPDAIAGGLGAVSVVPGRLERVSSSLDVPALVDYAHTPAALEAALEAVRELSDLKVAVVFGCGGERDRGKRPQMGRVAGELADLPVLTSDNPRREDPRRILAEAEEGLRRSGCDDYLVEPDRRAAIRAAVERARGGGFLVLVAGKGHEATQDLGDRVLPFDDRLELAAALQGAAVGGGPDAPGRRVALEVCHG